MLRKRRFTRAASCFLAMCVRSGSEADIGPAAEPTRFDQLPTVNRRSYMLLRYCPPTSNNAPVICPSEQTRTASISTSNTFRLSITAC